MDKYKQLLLKEYTNRKGGNVQTFRVTPGCRPKSSIGTSFRYALRVRPKF